MKKVLFYIVLLFGVLLIIVLYSPKYSPNLYNSDYYNSGYIIKPCINCENINLGDVSLNKNIVLKPDGLIVYNSVDNNVFDYDLNNNVLTTNNPTRNGGVVLTSPNSYNNTNRDINSTFNSIILPLSSNESKVDDDISTPLFSQQLPTSTLMRNNGHGNGIEDNNGDDHGNGHGWGRDGNEGNGNGNGGNCYNVPLNDELFVLLIFSIGYIVLKYLKIVK